MNRPIQRRTAVASRLTFAGLLLAAAVLAGCLAEPSPTGSDGIPSTAPRSAVPTATADPSPTAAPTPMRTASPTAEPALTLEPPERRDDRRVRFSVVPKVAADGDGEIQVTVENQGDSAIDEIVLRWPTALDAVLFLSPFTPTADRVREFGPPLHFPWTKWVEGPGELGEPSGTTSLGWGPLLPGAKLSIPIVVTRRAPGPVAFDLQLLAGVPHVAPVRPGGDALLSDPNGDPATTRVEVP